MSDEYVTARHTARHKVGAGPWHDGSIEQCFSFSCKKPAIRSSADDPAACTRAAEEWMRQRPSSVILTPEEWVALEGDMSLVLRAAETGEQ